jgi:hypothetical protein
MTPQEYQKIITDATNDALNSDVPPVIVIGILEIIKTDLVAGVIQPRIKHPPTSSIIRPGFIPPSNGEVGQ